MDETDKKILRIMQGNARISFEDLGKAIGMSRVAAQKRVKKLEKEGIIRGYNTCIYRDDEINACIDITPREGRRDAVIDYLGTKVEGIRQIFVAGNRKLIHVVLITDSIESLNYVFKMIKTGCKKDIEEISGYSLKEVIKDVYGGVRYESGYSASKDHESDEGT